MGQTLSAFNLVRIHLFGDDKPSFKKMVDFARNDEKVKNLIAEENIKSIKEDFGDEEIDFSWTKKLATNDDGDIANTVANLVIILENDEKLKGIAFNILADTAEVRGEVPWLRPTSTRFWRDADTSKLKAIHLLKRTLDNKNPESWLTFLKMRILKKH